MTPSTKVGIAGIVLGLILLAILPWWAAVGIIIIAAAIPVGGYMALDKSQRRRLRAIRAENSAKSCAQYGRPRADKAIEPRTASSKTMPASFAPLVTRA